VAPRVDAFWMVGCIVLFSAHFPDLITGGREVEMWKLLYWDFMHLTAVIFVVAFFSSGVYGALVISLSRRPLFHRIPLMRSLLARRGL